MTDSGQRREISPDQISSKWVDMTLFKSSREEKWKETTTVENKTLQWRNSWGDPIKIGSLGLELVILEKEV